MADKKLYTFSDYLDDVCTAEEYYKQFPRPDKLEKGKYYIQFPDTWQEAIYKVAALHDNVALCELVKDSFGGLSLGKKELFYSKGNNLGGRYGDARQQYRLIKEVPKP